MWLFTTISSIFLIPTALIVLVVQGQYLSTMGVLFILGTTLIHLVYFFCLQRGYRSGDLSLVYPLARGLGPALATVSAIVLLGERPKTPALVGVALVLFGVFLLAFRGGGGAAKQPGTAIYYGTVTGVLIALYTVWDKYAVSRLAVPPLVLEAFAGSGISLLLAPHAFRNWPQVKSLWKSNRAEVLGVAVLAPLSYILVLTAMSFTDLTYVAPTREVSILVAAVLGTRFLGEGNTTRRLVAAGLMVCGVVVLAVN